MSLEGRIRYLEQLAFDTIPSKLVALEIHEKTARQAFMGIPPWGFGIAPEPDGPKTPCCSGTRIPATLKCTLVMSGQEYVFPVTWKPDRGEWNGVAPQMLIYGALNPIPLGDGSFQCGIPRGQVPVYFEYALSCVNRYPQYPELNLYAFQYRYRYKVCDAGLGAIAFIQNSPGDYNRESGGLMMEENGAVITCKPFKVKYANMTFSDPAYP